MLECFTDLQGCSRRLLEDFGAFQAVSGEFQWCSKGLKGFQVVSGGFGVFQGYSNEVSKEFQDVFADRRVRRTFGVESACVVVWLIEN